MSAHKIVSIVHLANNNDPSEQTKDQKLFCRLTKKIEKNRQILQSWTESIPKIRQRVSLEFKPLQKELDDLHYEMLCCLDQAFSHQALTASHKKKIKSLILFFADDLLERRQDAALTDIYDRYNHQTFEAEQEHKHIMIRSMLQQFTGVTLDETADVTSPQDFMNKLKDAIQEREQHYPPQQRRKTKKTLEKEEREKQEEKKVSQSIRDIYRQLAAALHPDKELDDHEKQRKHAIMQRVNIAYDASDLLTLLELQLEAEQIDQDSIQSLSEERLQHYNKVLKKQSEQIEHEIIDLRNSLCMEYGIPIHILKTPYEALRTLEMDLALIQKKIDLTRHDLPRLQDSKQLKIWLKDIPLANLR